MPSSPPTARAQQLWEMEPFRVCSLSPPKKAEPAPPRMCVSFTLWLRKDTWSLWVLSREEPGISSKEECPGDSTHQGLLGGPKGRKWGVCTAF